ncbi:protein of unknown function [Pseudomonas sp. JV241A]|nr:protein of unknown function [Pseudomonas sp. JV241A]
MRPTHSRHNTNSRHKKTPADRERRLHALEYSGYQTRSLDLQRLEEGSEVADWIQGKIGVLS